MPRLPRSTPREDYMDAEQWQAEQDMDYHLNGLFIRAFSLPIRYDSQGNEMPASRSQSQNQARDDRARLRAVTKAEERLAAASPPLHSKRN